VSERLPRITAAELLRALQRDGWTIVRHKGGHAQLKHPTGPGGSLSQRTRASLSTRRR